MDYITQPDYVKYACSCGQLKPLASLYFCRHCLKIRCGFCICHEGLFSLATQMRALQGTHLYGLAAHGIPVAHNPSKIKISDVITSMLSTEAEESRDLVPSFSLNMDTRARCESGPSSPNEMWVMPSTSGRLSGRTARCDTGPSSPNEMWVMPSTSDRPSGHTARRDTGPSSPNEMWVMPSTSGRLSGRTARCDTGPSSPNEMWVMPSTSDRPSGHTARRDTGPSSPNEMWVMPSTSSDRPNWHTPSPEPQSPDPTPAESKRLSGAARRRFHKWLERGFTKEEALHLCRNPMSEVPYEDPKKQQVASTSDNSNRKRHISTETLPQEQPLKKKKVAVETYVPHAEPTDTFVTCPRKMGVKDEHRSLTAEEAELVKSCLLHKLDATVGEGPRFCGSTFRSGCLLLTCLNEATIKWLVTNVAGLQPWEDACLIVVDEKDLPKPGIATAYIPNGELDPKTILNRLDKQNPGIGCGAWRVINVKQEKEGQTVCFSLDSGSLVSLQKVNCRLCLDFGTILVRIKQGHKTEVAGNGASSVAVVPSVAPAASNTQQLRTGGGPRAPPVRTATAAASNTARPQQATSRGRGQCIQARSARGRGNTVRGRPGGGQGGTPRAPNPGRGVPSRGVRGRGRPRPY